MSVQPKIIMDNIMYFLYLYEVKSYRKCANMLGIQPSTLSKHITELESQLNKMLILRTSRRFEVTPFGEYVYNQFRHIPSFVDNSIQSFDNKILSTNLVVDELNVVLGPDISYQMVSPYLGQFIANYPNVKLNVSYIPYVNKWPGKNISLVLTIVAIKGENLDCRFIRKEYVKLYCSSSYCSKYGKPSSVNELKNHKLIGYVDKDFMPVDYHKIINSHTFDECVLDFTNNKINLNNMQQMLQFGINSDYIFLCTTSLVRGLLESGKVSEVLPDWVVREFDIYIYSKKNVTMIEQLFIDFIYEKMGKI